MVVENKPSFTKKHIDHGNVQKEENKISDIVEDDDPEEENKEVSGDKEKDILLRKLNINETETDNNKSCETGQPDKINMMAISFLWTWTVIFLF